MLPRIAPLVESYAGAFTRRSFPNFVFLLLSWIWVDGQRCLTSFLRHSAPLPDLVGSVVRTRGFEVLHRFFSRAVWSFDAVGRRVLRLALAVTGDGELLLALDDTLCRHSGRCVLGSGAHYDPLASRGRGKKTRTVVSFGLNFVVLAMWLPCSWAHDGGFMIPLTVRLYRPLARCPAEQYRKRTELAVELLRWVSDELDGRRARVAVDREYACETLLSALPPSLDLIGPMPANAALYAADFTQQRRGRPRKYGRRIYLPRLRATTASRLEVRIYGRTVKLLMSQHLLLWKPAGGRLLAVVQTSDPTGEYRDRLYFSTATRDGARGVVEHLAKRWHLETTFREAKQQLGMESTQNGYCHTPNGIRRKCKPRGLQAPIDREPLASARTAPMALLAYSVVVLWAVSSVDAAMLLPAIRRAAPWYTTKQRLSFTDLRNAFRNAMAEEFPHTHVTQGSAKSPPAQSKPKTSTKHSPSRQRRAA